MSLSATDRLDVLGVLAVFAVLFGLYGLVSPQRFEPGYEAMYPGAAEGLLRTGVPQLERSSPLFPLTVGKPGGEGPLYPGPTVGWAGPATAAPWMAAATVADGAAGVLSGSRSTFFRVHAAYTFAALLMAATGATLFAFARMLFGSRRRAAALALVAGLTTIVLPYARIGMEPPLAFWTTAAFALAFAARRRGSLWWWAAAGVAFGFATATRMPAAPVLVAPLVLYALAGIGRGRLAFARMAALLGPLVVANLLSLEYNRVRCHAAVCGFGQFKDDTDLHIRAGVFEGVFGFLLSPGKSIFVTSPILILAVVGLVRALRLASAEAIAIVSTAILGIVVLATLSYWSDEMYGARYTVYLVPLLALGIGYALSWDARPSSIGRTEGRTLVALAAVGAAIQVVAIIPSGGVSPCVYVAALLGPQRLDQNDCRFVPELSDVAMNARLTYGLVEKRFGGRPSLVYEPYVGTPGRDARHRLEYDFPLGGPPLEGPDVFWWGKAGLGTGSLFVFFAALVAGGAVGVAAVRRAPD